MEGGIKSFPILFEIADDEVETWDSKVAAKIWKIFLLLSNNRQIIARSDGSAHF